LELESSGDTKKKASFNGIFSLLLINFVAFAADHWLQVRLLTFARVRRFVELSCDDGDLVLVTYAYVCTISAVYFRHFHWKCLCMLCLVQSVFIVGGASYRIN
jgi:hypothetical protein